MMNNLYWIIFWICISKAFSADPTDISRLRTDLLSGYDKNARPIQNHQNTTVLFISPYIRAIEFPNDRPIFTVHCWTVMKWFDEHLKWDPKNYGNLTSIHFTSNEIWQPDLSVYNNYDQSEVDHFGNTRIYVENTGQVFWIPPTKFEVGCDQDLRFWPYDTQTCYMILGSWSHDGNSLDLQIPVNQTKLSKSEVAQNKEWEIINTSIRRRSFNYGTISYPDIEVGITVKRRSSVHTCAVVVPALAISIAILISFWLRPIATERLALILLVIMINSIYLNYVYVALKSHGDRIPLVLLFYRDSLIMVSIALIWTICLRYLAITKRTSPVPLPGFIEGFLSSFPAKILCLDPRPTPSTLSTETDDEGKLVVSANINQADWAWLAHLLDRIAFIIYLIVYISFYIALL